MLDGVYRRTDGEPVFVQADSPTDEELQALLHKIITRLMKLLTRRGVLIEEEGGSSYLADADADADADSDEARALRPLQAAACTYRIAFGPRAGPAAAHPPRPGDQVFPSRSSCVVMPLPLYRMAALRCAIAACKAANPGSRSRVGRGSCSKLR